MIPKPAVIFPDAKAWAVAYMNATLLARPIGDTYADAVTVAGRVPDVMPTRLVTIRDDGGTRALVTKSASLAVNVWAETEQVCSQLAALVVAILEASPGQGAVVAHLSTSGPVEVVESSTKPHRFASVDLSLRGTDL